MHMRIFWLVMWIVLTGVVTAHAETGLLFHADFDQDLQARHGIGGREPAYARRVQQTSAGYVGGAVRVPPGGQLVYHGMGNAYAPAGTLSFHWQMLQAPTGSFVIADLSPLERLNYGRLLRLSYNHDMPELYFTPPDAPGSLSRAAVALSVPELQHRLEAGRWYHVAIAWDQSRGVALYLDGQRVTGYDGPWYFGGHITRLGIGAAAGVDRPGASSQDHAFDQVRVYDRWLDEQAIADLAKGQVPEIADDLNWQALLDWRKQVMGWQDDLVGLPVVPMDGDGLGLRQLGVAASLDVKRRNWHVFAGQRGHRWPGLVAYTNGGQSLDIQLRPGQRVDVVQLHGRGPVALGVPSGQQMLDFRQPLLVVEDPAMRNHRTVLAEPVATDSLLLRRGGYSSFELDQLIYPTAPSRQRPSGVVFELNLFEQVDYPAAAIEAGQNGWERLSLRVGDLDALGDEADLVRHHHHPMDQTLLLTDAAQGQQAESLQVALPALRTVHLWGPKVDQRAGVDAVAVELHLIGRLPGAMRVDVFDPITRKRVASSADTQLAGEKGGPVRLMLDVQDQVLPAGARPWVAVTFDQEATLDLSRSALAVQWVSVQQAVPEHRAEQLARFSDLFQELSEGRPWGWRSKRVLFLQRIIAELRELVPDDPLVRGYWHWIYPNEPTPEVALPAVPAGQPQWAVYIDQAIEQLKQVPYWWIDHRENHLGEFGANDGINDDTDLVQDWWALHLMRGPDRRLFESLKRVADRSWLVTMRDGLNWPTTDALHAYEWGINAQTHMAMMDYGNPVYMARLMATARQYDRLMEVDAKGQRRFRAWYYGSQYVDTELRGVDREVNALLLQPAMLLAWYNGHPGMTQIVTEWTDSMMQTQGQLGRGLSATTLTSAALASYDLTGDRRYLDFLAQGDTPVPARYRFADDLDPQAAAHFAQAAREANLWGRSLHNSNYRDLDLLYLAWRGAVGTGQAQATDNLIEGLKLTLHALGWSLPMLTEAEQSTDRVWLPQRLVNRAVLGGPAMLRNELYPKQAVSWEHATGRVVPLVLSADRKHLRVRLANLDQQPATVHMRVWRLEHGRYRITQGPADAPKAPAGDETVLARFGVLPVTVPAGAVWQVDVQQVEAMDDIRQRPDLAVAVEDAFFNYDRGALTFQIHNIGAKPSGPFRVRVRVGDSADDQAQGRRPGAVLLDRQFDSLDAPLDLVPQQVGVKVWNLKPYVDQPLIIEIDPDAQIDEITRVNNRLTVIVSDLPGHDTLR